MCLANNAIFLLFRLNVTGLSPFSLWFFDDCFQYDLDVTVLGGRNSKGQPVRLQFSVTVGCMLLALVKHGANGWLLM